MHSIAVLMKKVYIKSKQKQTNEWHIDSTQQITCTCNGVVWSEFTALQHKTGPKVTKLAKVKLKILEQVCFYRHFF